MINKSSRKKYITVISFWFQQYQLPGLSSCFGKYGIMRKKIADDCSEMLGWIVGEISGEFMFVGKKKKYFGMHNCHTDSGTLMLSFTVTSPTIIWISQEHVYKVSRLASLRSHYKVTLDKLWWHCKIIVNANELPTDRKLITDRKHLRTTDLQ